MGKLIRMALDFSDHHGSHGDLLWVPDAAPLAKVDAIIVPTARRPSYLRTAVELASRLGSALVTLHSGKWTSAEAVARMAGPDINLIAIDLIDQSAPPLMDFETSRLIAGTRFARRADVSLKRNLGLLLSHAVGWQRIVFLDDDITLPDFTDLQRAAGLLDSYNGVGLQNEGFPDNSVVCHAFRMVGGRQQSFIGGGALAIHTSRSQSFFPDIYNEDWFYLLDPKKGLQPIAVTGAAVQRPYDPFRDAARARQEEFGDVLAEGIYWLLDQGRTLDDADYEHWREFLHRRRRFIEYILERLESPLLERAENRRVVAALSGALGRLALIQPRFCEQYVQAWHDDRASWESQVASADRNMTPAEALTSFSAMGICALSYIVREPD
jgi:hypothetical protein